MLYIQYIIDKVSNCTGKKLCLIKKLETFTTFDRVMVITSNLKHQISDDVSIFNDDVKKS